ncbi:hypothetical protein_gp056 [Bacillus phage vB_BceM_WH1]|nr:hypothetical protein_gp056 [Bacillus phage vB_BceM_WH1]
MISHGSLHAIKPKDSTKEIVKRIPLEKAQGYGQYLLIGKDEHAITPVEATTKRVKEVLQQCADEYGIYISCNYNEPGGSEWGESREISITFGKVPLHDGIKLGTKLGGFEEDEENA